MSQLASIYMVVVAVGLLAVMVSQYLRGKVELFSVRNVALLGFIVFQVTSAAIPLWERRNDEYQIRDWDGIGLRYSLMVTVFLGLLFLFYHWGVGVKKAARLTPTTKGVPPLGTILGLAGALTVLGVFFRFGLLIPYVGILANFVGFSFSAIAAGLIGWAWAPRLLNPAYIAGAAAVIIPNLAVTLVGQFGRRQIVGIGACLVWGMYYSSFRHQKPAPMLFKLSLLSLPPLVLVAAFTAVRGSGGEGMSLQQQMAAYRQADLGDGFAALVGGQNVAAGSMWIMENYPDRFPYDYMLTPRYFLSLPVPRAIWPTKPDALGTRLAGQANLKGVAADQVTISPGIIGHAAAEGGWPALILYGVIAGLFLRYFDELVRVSILSPFVVLPVGSALGHILGLFRGETGLFAFQYVVGVVGSYLALVVAAKGLEKVGWVRRPEPAPSAAEYEQEPSPEASPSADAYERG